MLSTGNEPVENWLDGFIINVFERWIKIRKIDQKFLFRTHFGNLTAEQILQEMKEKRQFGVELRRLLKLKLVTTPQFINSNTEEQAESIAYSLIDETLKHLEALSGFIKEV